MERSVLSRATTGFVDPRPPALARPTSRGRNRLVSTPLTHSPVDRLALELVETMIGNGLLAAELVVRFLDRLGVLPPLEERRKNPVALPREFLVELGAILRLALWEQAGIRDHLERGLPRAAQALVDLLVHFDFWPPGEQSGRPIGGLALIVSKISIYRLAWGGRAELNADVVLDEPDELLLERLADYLWAHRRAGLPRG
jgi:hypothetical protein